MGAEEIAIDHLRRSLGVHVATQTRRGLHPPYVTVERTGGPCDGYLDAASLAVQCWGADRSEAHALALSARAALMALADDERAASCDIQSLAWFPGERDEPRYQVAAQLTLYI